MSQNMPPIQPDQYDQGDRDPHDVGLESNSGDLRGNPYYANQHTAPPDLDAKAPVLGSADMQRLNRKALIFLAGIIALLLVMAIWLIKTARAGQDDVARQPREEKVTIPELPQAKPIEADTDATQAIALAPPILPPLPDESTSPSLLSPESQVPTGPSLLERRMMAGSSDSGGQPSGQPAQPDPYAQALLGAVANQGNSNGQAKSATEKATSAQFLNHPDALLVRGTYIRCVLETRIITDLPGFTSCIVTEPVYSINGRRLLLPKGSKLLGRYNTEPAGPRVSVIWDRITTPNGIDVSMASPGVDNLGGAGHPGDYNAHWASRVGSALLISLISDVFKYAGEKNGPTTTTAYGSGVAVEQPFQSNTARTVQRLADQAVDKSASRPATVTINQGTVVTVYVAQDVDFTDVVASL